MRALLVEPVPIRIMGHLFVYYALLDPMCPTPVSISASVVLEDTIQSSLARSQFVLQNAQLATTRTLESTGTMERLLVQVALLGTICRTQVSRTASVALEDTLLQVLAQKKHVLLSAQRVTTHIMVHLLAQVALLDTTCPIQVSRIAMVAQGDTILRPLAWMHRVL